MARPLIGLNTSQMDMETPIKAKAFCHLKYADAVIAAGGVPVLLPPYTERKMIEEALAPLDGFLLIGGPDYNPVHYGGHPQPAAELLHPRRDVFDLWLAEILLKHSRLPVLGICGGHQLLSIARGGALVQDIRSEWKSEPAQACPLQHSSDERKGTPQEGEAYRHEIKVAPESRLARIIGATKLPANSYHHQAVAPGQIGEGFVATAWAPDGVIEALEAATPGRFIVGVQWHPERQTESAPHLAIFQALVEEAGRK